MQEARCFNDPHIDPRRCQQVLTLFEAKCYLPIHFPALPELFEWLAGHHQAAISDLSRRELDQGVAGFLLQLHAHMYSVPSCVRLQVLKNTAAWQNSGPHPQFGAQKEATDVFFSVTKLYQSKDANLRRMVYLVIKEVCPSSDEVIIITSSLMKDMNSKTELYRSNAIRVLCSITDSQLLLQIERYLKQVCSI